jgi:SAM-dependent methyltransferase
MFWDFDHTLQKILLGVVNEIATPEQLAKSCIERWKVNLEHLYIKKQKELKELIESGKPYSFSYTEREKSIFERIKTKGRFLYLGCGSGTECLRLANQGYNVIGIDTDFKLVDVANDWAEYLALPFKAICMDATMLGLSRGVFDGFLLEFYGHHPSSSWTLALQRNLADVLSDRGIGFVVANRKKYCSFWFRASRYYKESMNLWLSKQSLLDFCFSQTDGCEEQLGYGLYWRTHTVDSLSAELSFSFDVVECVYDKYDPRYVMCLVKRKQDQELKRLAEESFEVFGVEKIHLDLSGTSIQDVLLGIDHICDFLESHEEKVSEYFDKYDAVDEKTPILNVQTELSGFIEMLISTFEVLPD